MCCEHTHKAQKPQALVPPTCVGFPSQAFRLGVPGHLWGPFLRWFQNNVVARSSRPLCGTAVCRRPRAPPPTAHPAVSPGSRRCWLMGVLFKERCRWAWEYKEKQRNVVCPRARPWPSSGPPWRFCPATPPQTRLPSATLGRRGPCCVVEFCNPVILKLPEMLPFLC